MCNYVDNYVDNNYNKKPKCQTIHAEQKDDMRSNDK